MPNGECSLSAAAGKVSSSNNPPAWQKNGATILKIECYSSNIVGSSIDGGAHEPYWSMMLQFDVDPRLLTAGQAVQLETSESEVCESVGILPGIPVETLWLFVEEAVGGPADFPAIVTIDYRRIFRIEYATSGRWPSAAGGCTPDTSVDIVLRLTQTAADFSLVHGACAKCI